MTEQQPTPHEPHESFDNEIGVRNIARFGIGLGILIVVSGLVSWWVFAGLRRAEVRRDPLPSPIVQRQGTPEVPQPRLQTTPEQDLAALRAEERELLEGYAWLDRDAGVVRVPVALSIELLLQRGLPTRAGAPAWHRPVWRNPTHSRLHAGPQAGEDVP